MDIKCFFCLLVLFTFVTIPHIIFFENLHILKILEGVEDMIFLIGSFFGFLYDLFSLLFILAAGFNFHLLDDYFLLQFFLGLLILFLSLLINVGDGIFHGEKSLINFMEF